MSAPIDRPPSIASATDEADPPPSFDTDPAALALAVRAEEDPAVKQEIIQELVVRQAPQAFDVLVELLADADADVRIVAAEGLAQLGDPRAVAAVERAMSVERDPDVGDALAAARTRW